MNSDRRKIRVLLAKPTHDCHDRGVRYLAGKFRDHGYEVVFSNFLLPEEVVATATQEGVDVIGVSFSAGGHMPAMETIVAGLETHGLRDECLILCGGVIPADDARSLLERGIAGVFGPGSSAADAIALIDSRYAAVS